MNYYRLVSNHGRGDIYYCSARNIGDAREKCGLEPKRESGAEGCRISAREYDEARRTNGVHII